MTRAGRMSPIAVIFKARANTARRYLSGSMAAPMVATQAARAALR
jgi:hypothetical protein